MELGATNWAYLYRRTLHGAFEDLADAGYQLVECCATPPHVYTPSHGRLEARELKALFARRGLHCLTVNPTEMNLVSPNPGIRQFSLDQYIDCLRFGMEIGAKYLVVIPGRMNPIMPVPYESARDMLLEALDRLVRASADYGMEVTLETSPFGFLGTGSEIRSVVDEIDSPRLGITFDVANVFAQEDPVKGIQDAGDRIRVVHLSDSWKTRFAHAAIGTGEIDFPAVYEALCAVGFDGPVIYELVDGQDPSERFRSGRATLEAMGFGARRASAA